MIIRVITLLLLTFISGMSVKAQTQTKTYQINTVEEKDSVSWDEVPKAGIDIYKWTDSDTFNAFAQMVYVKDYGLVCKMSCEESDPYTRFYKDGEDVCKDSAMELFLKLGEEGYINLETNSAGARVQQFGKARENRTSVFDMIPEGFRVDAGREGEYWTLMIYLPVEELKLFYPDIDYSTFDKNYTFTGNFYKIGTNPDTGVRHYGMWNDVDSEEPNFHLPEYFGKMTIGE